MTPTLGEIASVVSVRGIVEMPSPVKFPSAPLAVVIEELGAAAARIPSRHGAESRWRMGLSLEFLVQRFAWREYPVPPNLLPFCFSQIYTLLIIRVDLTDIAVAAVALFAVVLPLARACSSLLKVPSSIIAAYDFERA